MFLAAGDRHYFQISRWVSSEWIHSESHTCRLFWTEMLFLCNFQAFYFCFLGILRAFTFRLARFGYILKDEGWGLSYDMSGLSNLKFLLRVTFIKLSFFRSFRLAGKVSSFYNQVRFRKTLVKKSMAKHSFQ